MKSALGWLDLSLRLSLLVLPLSLGASSGCSRLPIADQLVDARAQDGRFLHWVEHRVNDSGLDPTVSLRGADRLS